MKILIGLDLDDTHFFSKKRNGVHWIGEKTARLQFYENLVKVAEEKGIEVIFSVLTAKTHFDDICQEAAFAFQRLISRQNKNMYIFTDGLEYLLVSQNAELHYQCLTRNLKKEVENPRGQMHSHFNILRSADFKVSSLLNIGRKHGIPPERTILLDDLDPLLANARKSGIKTVSFGCFNPANPNRCVEDDEATINKNLEEINLATRKIFEEICDAYLAERAAIEEESSAKRQCIGGM